MGGPDRLAERALHRAVLAAHVAVLLAGLLVLAL
jgi:hypothetical protein